MGNYLSYKGVKIALEKWSQGDPNIKSFGFGPIFDANGKIKTEQVYPAMWVTPTNTSPTITQNGMITINRSYQILFYDTKLADNTNELQVQSDMEELCIRFIKWCMNANDPEINIITNPSWVPFSDKFLDDVAGQMMTITIELTGDMACDDPNTNPVINFL